MIERSFNHLQLHANQPEKRSALLSPGVITGYSSVYNSLSEDLGGFKERVASTAFSKSIRNNADVRCLINHDPNLVIGRVSNRTLRLTSNSKGLHMECTLPDCSYARDLYTSISRGDINSQSFAFTVDADGDTWDEEIDPETNSKIPVRTLRSVSLLDCSAVLNPAYASSSVSALPQMNSLPLDAGFAPSRELPSSIPVEFRSRIVLAHYHQRSRRKILNLMLS
jgi:hypothetical protein